jgi:hypothetical protein
MSRSAAVAMLIWSLWAIPCRAADSPETYKCKIRLIEGGRKLVVRGYVGLAMFGRTQTWFRMD